MAKSYRFIIAAIKADFKSSPGSVIIDFRSFHKENHLARVPFEGSLKEAVAQREVEAQKLNKPAAWFIEMADGRDAKKPPGFKAIKEMYYEPKDSGSEVQS